VQEREIPSSNAEGTIDQIWIKDLKDLADGDTVCGVSCKEIWPSYDNLVSDTACADRGDLQRSGMFGILVSDNECVKCMCKGL